MAGRWNLSEKLSVLGITACLPARRGRASVATGGFENRLHQLHQLHQLRTGRTGRKEAREGTRSADPLPGDAAR